MISQMMNFPVRPGPFYSSSQNPCDFIRRIRAQDTHVRVPHRRLVYGRKVNSPILHI